MTLKHVYEKPCGVSGHVTHRQLDHVRTRASHTCATPCWACAQPVRRRHTPLKGKASARPWLKVAPRISRRLASLHTRFMHPSSFAFSPIGHLSHHALPCYHRCIGCTCHCVVCSRTQSTPATHILVWGVRAQAGKQQRSRASGAAPCARARPRLAQQTPCSSACTPCCLSAGSCAIIGGMTLGNSAPARWCNPASAFFV